MDDLLLFTLEKRSHKDKLIDLLKALLKNGLKISPKKCQFIKKDLQYTGNTISTKEGMYKIHEKQDIQRLKPPTAPEGCRSFAAVVELSTSVLPLATEMTNTYIWPNKKDILLGNRAMRSF